MHFVLARVHGHKHLYYARRKRGLLASQFRVD